MSKPCTKCHEEKPLDDFYPHPMAADGRLARCKECTKAYVRANRAARSAYYAAFDKSRAKDPRRVEARKQYALKHSLVSRPEPDPQKRSARLAVGNAVRDGRLLKATECEICACSEEPHAHHDDYSKPLEVIWACTACHALIHRYWQALDRKGF